MGFIMQSQMEKNMENEMETGVVYSVVGKLIFVQMP